MSEQAPNSHTHRSTPGVSSGLQTGQMPGQPEREEGRRDSPAPAEEGRGEGLPRESLRLQSGLLIELKSPAGGVSLTSWEQPTGSAAQPPRSGGLERLQPSWKAIYAPGAGGPRGPAATLEQAREKGLLDKAPITRFPSAWLLVSSFT